jgi:hypothetical protein
LMLPLTIPPKLVDVAVGAQILDMQLAKEHVACRWGI